MAYISNRIFREFPWLWALKQDWCSETVHIVPIADAEREFYEMNQIGVGGGSNFKIFAYTEKAREGFGGKPPTEHDPRGDWELKEIHRGPDLPGGSDFDAVALVKLFKRSRWHYEVEKENVKYLCIVEFINVTGHTIFRVFRPPKGTTFYQLTLKI